MEGLPERTVTGSLLWDGDNVWLLWIVATGAVAYVVHRIVRQYQMTPPPQNAKQPIPVRGEDLSMTSTSSGSSSFRTRESRLLQKKFGVISDDLALQEEEETEDKDKDNEARQSTSIDELEQPTEDPEPLPASETKTPDGNESVVHEDESEEQGVFTSATDDEVAPHPTVIDETESTSAMNKKPKKTRTEKVRERLAAAALARLDQQPPPFLRANDSHPGLASFWHWCDVEASLFRIFTVTRKDGVQDETTIAPYNPSSRRGNVPIKLRVTNDLDNVPVTVYWIDFKGAHVVKGTISPNGGTWRQTTWIDHPWIFCATDQTTGEEKILLHYIPYRVIPTTAQAPTVDTDDEPDSGKTGVHQFRIAASPADSRYSCAMDDPIFPHPAEAYIPTPHKAAEFALLHCLRMDFGGWAVLKKYFTMIVQHPDKPQYRQIRTANRTFAQAVWNTPAKGVLLAAGFVEHGAYAELGSAAALSHDTVNELSLLLYVIERWQKRAEDSDSAQQQQPEGADGYGRAGFGR